jgi:hypothetical protein
VAVASIHVAHWRRQNVEVKNQLYENWEMVEMSPVFCKLLAANQ